MIRRSMRPITFLAVACRPGYGSAASFAPQRCAPFRAHARVSTPFAFRIAERPCRHTLTSTNHGSASHSANEASELDACSNGLEIPRPAE